MQSKIINKVTLQLRLSEDVIVKLNELKKRYGAIDNASFISALIVSAYNKLPKEVQVEMEEEKK